jgi:tetratricopeptide (TPR) repeat protein
MINPVKNRASIIFALCLSITACAGAPEIDQRPKLLISAEKSLSLGVSSYNENNFTKAEAHFDRALFLYRNIDNPNGITSSCLNIAKTKLSSGHVNEARAYAEQAQVIIQNEQLNEYNERLTLIQTSIAIEDGNFQKAKQMLDNLLSKSPTSNDASIRTAAVQNRTRVAFLTNADDTSDWVEEYRNALNKPAQNTALNQARLLRFQATLNPDSTGEKLSSALSLYRKAAHAPGIAATLFEWGTHDNATGATENAIDKLHRALFIRTNLQDRINSQKVLQQLAASYSQLGETSKSERANYWQKKLDSEIFGEWESIRFEFENYPG